MRGAVKRVLGEDEQEGGSADDSMSAEDVTSLVSQLREARSLLREQDAIMFAAIFDKCVRIFFFFSKRIYIFIRAKKVHPFEVLMLYHSGRGCGGCEWEGTCVLCWDAGWLSGTE